MPRAAVAAVTGRDGPHVPGPAGRAPRRAPRRARLGDLLRGGPRRGPDGRGERPAGRVERDLAARRPHPRRVLARPPPRDGARRRRPGATVGERVRADLPHETAVLEGGLPVLLFFLVLRGAGAHDGAPPTVPADRAQNAPFSRAVTMLSWCSAKVSAKHDVPSVWQRTKYSHGPASGESAASMASGPTAAIGVGGSPAVR